MNSVDMAIFVALVVCGVLGTYWGLIRQVLAVAGLAAGIVVAARYGGAVADALSSFIANDAVAQLSGFVLVLVAVSALSSLLATLLHRFAGLLFLGWLDHLAGGVLGLLQAGLISTVVVLAAAAFPSELWASALRDSRLAGPLVQLFGFVVPALPAPFHAAARAVAGVS